MSNLIKGGLIIIDRNWKFISGATLLLITVLSLIPLPELPLFPGSDKTHHIIAYSILMFPVALHKPKGWLWIAFGFIVWSGMIELIQPYVNRYGEWLDFLANALGVVIACLAAKSILVNFQRAT